VRFGARLVAVSDENDDVGALLRKLADFAAAKAIIAYHENPEEALRHARQTVEEGHAIYEHHHDVEEARHRHDAEN
jgi:hypothetical protein